LAAHATRLVAAVLALGTLGVVRVSAAPAGSEAPARFCARAGNDDALRPAPASLGPAIRELFHIGGEYALRTTVWRCAGGKLLLCNLGANLPCGKADTRTELPGTRDWCRDHPNADFIPMVVTGHDTAYAWRCAGGVPKIEGRIGKLDDRGFFAQYWKRLP
jgi:hypothetical protein